MVAVIFGIQGVGKSSIAKGVVAERKDYTRIHWGQYSLNAAGTAFTMKSNSFLLLDRAYNTLSLARQVSLTGVYSEIDMRGAQTGTNLIADTNTLARTTWICTLTTPGTPLADVNVNQTIKGALVNLVGDVKLRKAGQNISTGVNVYHVALSLIGV